MSQGSLNVPTGGSESAITFAGQCNTAWNALTSMNSGASAPANGPGSAPVQFQMWADTTNAAAVKVKIYDSVNWPSLGTLDVVNSLWLPQLAGGVAAAASAGTLDLGLIPQNVIQVSGATTITSFGTSAPVGAMKMVEAAGQFGITNSASIICPGGSSLVTISGDYFWVVHYGLGVWAVKNYVRASAAAGTGLPTGAVFWRYSSAALGGFARCNFNTIGNTGSAATEGTGPTYFSLYSLLWTNSTSDPEVVVSGGRGATALADWAALKTITLPDMRGRTPFGMDTMGNTVGAASRLTSTTANPDGNTIGAVAGAGQTITIAQVNLPSFNLQINTLTWTMGVNSLTWTQGVSSVSVAGSNGSITGNNTSAGASANFLTASGGNTPQQTPSWTQGASSVTVAGSVGGSVAGSVGGSLASGGSGTAKNITPALKVGTWYIAL